MSFETQNDQRFKAYLNELIHDWGKTLTILGISLVPVFFALDLFIAPPELYEKFFIYRMVPTVCLGIQLLVLKFTKPGSKSYISGYVVVFSISIAIIMMTVDLGGFTSPYYAGVNLAIFAVTIMLPWGAVRSAICGFGIIAIYVAINIVGHTDGFRIQDAINNLFFMNATVILSTAINHARFKLIESEYYLRIELKEARDALWGEMKIAKKIQQSLLPENIELGNYALTAFMSPADEVGGDYYDFIQTRFGESWVAIGDVSGHGVESGLIMMMTQTSIYSIVNSIPGYKPSEVLTYTNTVIRNNISRLSINRFMTIFAIKLDDAGLTVAGKHMDIFIHRKKTNTVDSVNIEGTWLCLARDISDFLQDYFIPIESGDTVLLFTDGVTEAINVDGDMFGEEKLMDFFAKNVHLDEGQLVKRIFNEVVTYQDKQLDDITILVLRKL